LDELEESVQAEGGRKPWTIKEDLKTWILRRKGDLAWTINEGIFVGEDY